MSIPILQDGGADFDPSLFDIFPETGWSPIGQAATITYSFDDGPYYFSDDSFTPGLTLLDTVNQEVVQDILDDLSTYANITFVEGEVLPFDEGLTFGIWSDPGGFTTGVATVLSGPAGEATINTAYIDPVYGLVPGTYSYGVWIHEVLHTLNVSHPGDNPIDPTYSWDSTLMSYQGGEYTGFDFPTNPITAQLYDIAILQYFFGANTSTNAGDTTHILTDTGFRSTIWDGGGHDTVDASGNDGIVTIDLRENVDKVNIVGSSIYWFAFGSNIEDAIGSNYSDIINGNTLDNVLDGGGSGDIINGGGGNDTLIGGGGDDIYLISEVDVGNVYIADMSPGNDVIEIENGFVIAAELDSNDDGVVDAADNFVSNDPVTGDLVISLTTGDITVGGVTSLSLDDFAFVAAGLTIVGGPGNEIMNGSAGNDVMKGKGGNDTMDGGLGDDVMRGGKGDDLISGAEGNDTVYGNLGHDTLTGGLGDDTISGGLGDDTAVDIDLQNFSFLNSLDQGNDLYLMGIGNDYNIIAGPGDDTVFGGIGHDIINVIFFGFGGEGDDQLFGGIGDDLLIDGTGNDLLNGGLHDDTMVGGYGDDSLIGGQGKDVYAVLAITQDNESIDFGDDVFFDVSKHDLISLENLAIDGSYFDSNQDGKIDEHDDRAHEVEIDNDTSLVLTFDQGTITIRDDDDLKVNDFRALTLGPAFVGTEFSNIFNGGAASELIQGLDGDDILSGGGGVNTIEGGAGSDTLSGASTSIDEAGNILFGRHMMDGGDGDDLLIDGRLTDTMLGGDGDDVLQASAGSDILTGGSGADRFAFVGVDLLNPQLFQILGDLGHNVITDFEVGVDTLDLLLLGDYGMLYSALNPDSSDFIDVTDPLVDIVDGDMVININPGSSIRLENITSLHIDDIVIAGKPIFGTEFDDVLIGSDQTDQIFGLGGNDLIIGGDGNDTLDGGTGDDTIEGGGTEFFAIPPQVTNQLTGGDGADVFVMSKSNDIITDFMTGVDKIDYVSTDFNSIFGRTGQEFDINGDGLINAADGAVVAGVGIVLGVAFGPGQVLQSVTLENVFEISVDDFAGVQADPPQTIIGTGGDDILVGGTAADLIAGLAGNDVLVGNEGDDSMAGGSGMDTLLGGDGQNILVGGDADPFTFAFFPDGASDRYVIEPVSTGAETVILDFESGIDLLDISPLGFPASTFDPNGDGVVTSADSSPIATIEDYFLDPATLQYGAALDFPDTTGLIQGISVSANIAPLQVIMFTGTHSLLVSDIFDGFGNPATEPSFSGFTVLDGLEIHDDGHGHGGGDLEGSVMLGSDVMDALDAYDPVAEVLEDLDIYGLSYI